jgi:N-acetylglucosamine kinase-like BadF-type ATPase
LERFNGNVSAVVAKIEQKRHKPDVHALYATQLSELAKNGHTSTNVCIRLLRRYNGDVRQVIGHLRSSY